MENIIEIGEFEDFFQATMAKEILESNGIHCVITNVNLSLLDISTDIKVKLMINKDDQDKAKELLASFFTDKDQEPS